MSNWFNPDNAFFSFIGKIFDVLVINTLWLVFWLPLPAVTIVLAAATENYWFLLLTVPALFPLVPATTAMYYTIVKVIRRERSYAAKEFFRSFKRNLKQGAFFSILAAVVVFVMYIDFRYSLLLMEQGESSGNTFFGIFLVIAFLAVAIYLYICPVLSRFEMKLGGILKTSFYMATRHFLTTIILLVLFAGVLLGSFILVPGIFFLPATGTLLASFLMERVFKKYMPAKKERVEEGTVLDAEEREDATDEWYLE